MQRTVMSKAVLGVLVGAVASFLTPAAANAAVVCGQTIATTTTLTNDLTCPGTGIVINADNVTLSLGGHTITGAGPNAGFTGIVVASGRSSATIANGTVRNFGRGVAVNPGANDATIVGLTVDGNGSGISTFTNPATGVVPERARITGNTISNTLNFNGIQLGGNGHRVEANTITQSASSGILLFGNDNVISGNSIDASGARGISLGQTPETPGPFLRNQLRSNRVTRSARTFSSSSIAVQFARDTVVSGNTVEGVLTTPGVLVENSSGTLVSANTLAGNGSGILVRNNAVGTTLDRNRVQNNQTGIIVSSPAGATLVTNNVANDNTFDGINVGVATTTIAANTAYRNGSFGIRAVSGVIDGGDNRAFANGGAAQCSPSISCS